jgi:hypothetical protein
MDLTIAEQSPLFIPDDEPEVIQDGELARLKGLVDIYESLSKDIDALNDKLKLKKTALDHIAQTDIPTLLHQHGLSELRLDNGKKVIVKRELSVTVPEEIKPKFYSWLTSRKEDDIIKVQMAFDRMAPEKLQDLYTFLNGYEYAYESTRGVHHKTLQKYFKELLGIGDENQAQGITDGKYLRIEDIKDIANVFVYYDTKIK